jgi:hypothetical protein
MRVLLELMGSRFWILKGTSEVTFINFGIGCPREVTSRRRYDGWRYLRRTEGFVPSEFRRSPTALPKWWLRCGSNHLWSPTFIRTLSLIDPGNRIGRTFPTVPFERYADDLVAHCKTEQQAQQLKAAVAARLAECKLELHPEKTKIVYCKDDDRKGTYIHEKFDFLGYTFQARRSKNRWG